MASEPSETATKEMAQVPELSDKPDPVVSDPTAAPTTEQKEPQNPLTEHFTETEWTALKEFRKLLPEVLKEASVDSTVSSEGVELWGVRLYPGEVEKDARASVVLMKFLRARNLSISEAKSMLINTLRWRSEIDIPKIMAESFPEDVFGNLGHVYGKDKGGRPVTYNLYGGNQDLNAVFGDTQRFIRWRVALMEKGVKLLDFEKIDQMVQVHDYEGVSMFSRTPESKAAASEATNIFQSHYPELLYKKYFVNVPAIMSWLFWTFKPLLSAATIAKMSVVGKGQHTIGKELGVIIDPKELPKRYGGEAEAF